MHKRIEQHTGHLVLYSNNDWDEFSQTWNPPDSVNKIFPLCLKKLPHLKKNHQVFWHTLYFAENFPTLMILPMQYRWKRYIFPCHEGIQRENIQLFWITSSADGGEWSTSCTSCFTSASTEEKAWFALKLTCTFWWTENSLDPTRNERTIPLPCSL